MAIELLRRRDEIQHQDAEAPAPVVPPPAESGARALDRLDRWIEGGAASFEPGPAAGREERTLVGSPAQRAGKGAMRMAEAEARKAAAEAARKDASKVGPLVHAASAKVARLFAENGQRQAAMAFSRVPQRTLVHLSETLPKRTEAHILEHTREIVGKPKHTLFNEGTQMPQIVDMMLTTVRSGARPMLSVSDNNALAFVFEKEFPHAIGTKGERILRVVVDQEGRAVTAFPVQNGLKAMSIRGITVVASLAPVAFVSALAESEREAATADAAKRSADAQKSGWTEKILSFVGPYGIFDSSPIAIGPNFSEITKRTQAAWAEARASLGRELTTEEQSAIRQCVYDAWASAAGEVTA